MLVTLLISEGMSAFCIRNCKDWEHFRAAQNLVGSLRQGTTAEQVGLGQQ